jgi:hypothetical protein
MIFHTSGFQNVRIIIRKILVTGSCLKQTWERISYRVLHLFWRRFLKIYIYLALLSFFDFLFWKYSEFQNHVNNI